MPYASRRPVLRPGGQKIKATVPLLPYVLFVIFPSHPSANDDGNGIDGDGRPACAVSRKIHKI
jgi:hypothetical protein